MKFKSVDIEIEQSLLATVIRHLEVAYPDEGCGLLLAPDTSPARPSRFRACRNAQDDLHASDPDAHPRTARNAYSITPGELFEIERELRANSETIFAICHSHPDAAVYFSQEDHARAVVDDSPLYPDALQIVVSVIAGKAGRFGIFAWDAETGRYRETLHRTFADGGHSSETAST